MRWDLGWPGITGGRRLLVASASVREGQCASPGAVAVSLPGELG